jgi:hypothetical protein
MLTMYSLRFSASKFPQTAEIFFWPRKKCACNCANHNGDHADARKDAGARSAKTIDEPVPHGADNVTPEEQKVKPAAATVVNNPPRE